MDEETDAAKRQRGAAEPALALPLQRQTWPSTVELYERGLENKAEAATSSSTWSVQARDWRTQAFASADEGGARLKQRQAEVRRLMLQQSQRAAATAVDAVDSTQADATMEDGPT